MKLNIQNAWTVDTRNTFLKGGLPIYIVGNSGLALTPFIPPGSVHPRGSVAHSMLILQDILCQNIYQPSTI